MQAKVGAMRLSDGFEMEPEYDFSDGVPNPYAARFAEGGMVVVPEPDVSAALLGSMSDLRHRML
jgi:hypothetical protein